MLKVFAADSTDINWMVNLYLDGAKDGHFLLDMSDKNYLDICQRNINSIVLQKQIIDFRLQAYAMIFEDEENKIGYAVMSEIQSGIGGNELHLFIVDRDHRNKGYGNRMLSEIIKRIHPIADIYIRCFATSTAMKSLAQKNGFRYSHTNSENAEVYILRRQ
jgi:RimJ/RimL family protein N-acetyltransferase